MGKAGEHCKLPCLMDSGIQLSIQKFQTFKRDQIKWFSPQEVNTQLHSSVVPLFMSAGCDGTNAFEKKGDPCPLLLPAQGHSASFRAPYNFRQHRRASRRTQGHLHMVLNTPQWPTSSVVFTMLKKNKEESSWLPCLGNNCPDRGTESCGCTNNSKGCTASPELGAQWEQWPCCSFRWFAPTSLLGDAMIPGAGRGTEPPPAPPAPNSFIIHSLFINNKLVTMNARP